MKAVRLGWGEGIVGQVFALQLDLSSDPQDCNHSAGAVETGKFLGFIGQTA